MHSAVGVQTSEAQTGEKVSVSLIRIPWPHHIVINILYRTVIKCTGQS